MRGGDGVNCVYNSGITCDAISPSYAANKAVIESMFGAGCSEEYQTGTDNAGLGYGLGTFGIMVYADGVVVVSFGRGSCLVALEGNSYCNWD